MLTTGNQLKAARALIGMDQGTLAKRSGVNINTISMMESRGPDLLTSGFDKVTAVMVALQDEAVEFLNHGKPGVRLMNQIIPGVSGSFHEIRSLEWTPWQKASSDDEIITRVKQIWPGSCQHNSRTGVCYVDVAALLPVAEWQYLGDKTDQPWEYRHRVKP